jgi:hypothetical protein
LLLRQSSLSTHHECADEVGDYFVDVVGAAAVVIIAAKQ